MPDFVQVYNFLGSVFDPSTRCHLQKLKEMDPVDVETVCLYVCLMILCWVKDCLIILCCVKDISIQYMYLSSRRLVYMLECQYNLKIPSLNPAVASNMSISGSL